MSVVERPVPASPAVDVRVDERAARRSLRAQIARLEHELVTVANSAYPRLPLPQRPRARTGGPRLLSLGDLECTRDDVAARLHELRQRRAALIERQAEARLLVERMLLEPGHHRWVTVTNDDLGEPGCKTYAVRPRLGLVGMLAGWWHVKVSSGCPLATGPWPAPRFSTEAGHDEMGRRSRKRPTAPVEQAPAPARPVRPVQSTAARRPGQSRIDRFIERADERPKPPWHPVPLVEIAVLVGIALIVIGLINSDTSKGRIAMVFGLALASLAGLDTAVREHFAGFRSHSSLLGGMPAVVVVAVLGLAGAPVPVLAVAGLVVFGGAFWACREAFRRRTGVPFKV